MESVVLSVQGDDVAHAFELDLSEFYDYVTSHELSFQDEFHLRITEYLIQNSESEERTSPDYEPITGNLSLDHERFFGYVSVTVADGPEGWHRLAKELEALCAYAWGVDDDHLIGYLALLDDSWSWEAMTEESEIEERMSSFKGIYNSLTDVLLELIAEGELDEPPAWVVWDEEASASEAEVMGYFSSFYVNAWAQAVFI